MPIKMLTPSFARIGYIKIGDKGGKSGSPRKFDHFEIRTIHKDSEGNLLPDLLMMERLGERPTSLKIRLPFNDLDMVFNSTLAYYRGRNRFCWGDGETAQRLSTVNDGSRAQFGPAQPYGPCGETCADFRERRCKPLGVLQVILEDQQQIGGAYVFKTTSWNSIRNILTSLTAIKAQAGGHLAWIPLTMKLVPQTVQPMDGTAANTAYIVQIAFDGNPQQLLSTVREMFAMRAPLIQEIRELEAGLKALPAAVEGPEEAADTQEEFYPELAEAGPEGVVTAPPTVEEVDQLLALMVEAYVDREVIRQHIRRVMQLAGDQQIGKKWLTKKITRAQLEGLKDAAGSVLKAAIMEEGSAEEEEDEPLFGETKITQTIESDVPMASGPEAPGSTLTHEPTIGEVGESLNSDDGTTTRVIGNSEAVQLERDDLADAAEIERVRIYADSHALGKDFMQSLSHYPRGISQAKLEEIEARLKGRVEQQANVAKV